MRSQAQANAEQARAEVERTLERVRQAKGAEAKNTEQSPTALGEEGVERRISFIIQLTVDERGRPRRTEVQHAQSGKR